MDILYMQADEYIFYRANTAVVLIGFYLKPELLKPVEYFRNHVISGEHAKHATHKMLFGVFEKKNMRAYKNAPQRLSQFINASIYIQI